MHGEKIYLRALEPGDIDILLEMENDTDIWKVSNTTVPFSRFDMEQYLMTGDKDIYKARQLRLMIAEKKSDKTLGAIDLYDFDPANRRAGVGILICKKHRSSGAASEALELLKEYAFKTLSLTQIYAQIHTDNETSIQLFRKHGFSESGILKKWTLYNNVWLDTMMLQYINPDIKS